MRLAQRAVAPLLAGGLRIVDLPAVPSGPLVRRLAERGVRHVDDRRSADLARLRADVERGEVTVVLLPDAFSAFLEPDVFDATIEVLWAAGERPAVARFLPSGKYDHVSGRRARFRRASQRRRDQLERLAGAIDGAGPQRRTVDLVQVEPAVALLAGHEDRAIDPGFPSHLVRSLAPYLAERHERLAAVAGTRTGSGPVRLFGHCAETSLAPDHQAAYRTLLEACGLDVVDVATTCCGMAGSFGLAREHRSMSTDLFDLGWREPLVASAADGAPACASGASCRAQARRFGFDAVHPVQVVAAALTRR